MRKLLLLTRSLDQLLKYSGRCQRKVLTLLCGAVADEEGELEPAKVKLVNSNAKINRRLTSDAVHSDSGSKYAQIADLSTLIAI